MIDLCKRWERKTIPGSFGFLANWVCNKHQAVPSGCRLGELVFHIKGMPWNRIVKAQMKKPGGIFFTINLTEKEMTQQSSQCFS